MGESSYASRPKLLLQNGRTPDKYSSATLSMGRERAVSGDVSRMNQRDAWDQSASYRQNLGLSNVELNKYGPNSTSVHEYMTRAWEPDRREGSRQNASNPLDMSIPRSQHIFTHTVHASEQPPTMPTASRNSRSFLTNPAPPYLSRGSPFANSTKNPPHRSNRNSDTTALLEAVQKRDQAEIARLLQNGVDVNATEAGYTALHQAAKNGDVEIINCLLMRGANATLRDQCGRMPEFYSMKHNISVDNLLREMRLVSQRSSVHSAQVDWHQQYSKEASASALPTSFVEPRSTDHRQPDHQQPDHRQPDHRQLDHRQRDNRQPDHRQPRSMQKPRFHRSSPAHHDASLLQYGKSDKQDDRYNHADSQKASRYDWFPKPFDHMLRPPQSDSVPPGLEPAAQTNTAEHNLSLSNGPKSYRISEPVSSSKYPLESSSVRPKQRRSFPTSQKLPATEKQMPLSELKKPSFLIDELTKSASLSQNPKSANDKTDGLHYLKQTALTDLHDHSALMLGVDPSRLSSPFQSDIYSLPTPNTLEAQRRLSVANPHHPLYYYPGRDVPFPVQPVLYHRYINPANLPIPAHGGQVNPSQEHAALLQPLRPTSSNLNSCEPGAVPTNAEIFSRKVSEQTVKVPERHSPSPRYHDNLAQERYSSKDIPPEVRSALNEEIPLPNVNRNSSFSLPSHSMVPPTTSFETTPKSSSPLPISSQHHHSDPVSSMNPSHTLQAKTFHTRISREETLQDTDMRQIVHQEIKDTDMRPFLHPPHEGAIKSVTETPARRMEKNPKHQYKSETNSMPKANLDTISNIPQLISSHKRDHTESKGVVSRASYSPTNSLKTFAKSINEDISDKTKTEVPQKRKYKKVTAPIAKLAEPTVEDQINNKTRDEKTSKSEPKPKGRKGRKRKHFPDQSNEPNVSTDASIKEVDRIPSVENDGISKREKRRKKSEPEDEYVYDWMYGDFSSEPENDDSEDEDFQCPYQKQATPGKRERKRTMPKRSPRQSSQRIRAAFYDGESTGDEQQTDEEPAAGKSRRFIDKPVPGKRGPKPGPRVTRASPRKSKKTRKLSSDSTESERSYDDAPRNAKINKTKKRVRLISSDKEEKIEAEKPVIKRGRGRRKMSDKKDSLRSKKADTDEKSITKSNTEDEKLKPAAKPTKEKTATSKNSSERLKEETVEQKPDVTEAKKKGKTRRSVSEAKVESDVNVDSLKETELAADVIPESKVTSDPIQKLKCTIDLTQESKATINDLKETNLTSDASMQEDSPTDAAKRPSKSVIPAKRGRKPKDLKKGSILTAEEKRKSKLTYGAKRVKELTNVTKREHVLASDAKRENANDTKREKANGAKQDNLLDNNAKRENINAVKREKVANVASDVKRENKSSGDTKRESKLAIGLKPIVVVESKRENAKKEEKIFTSPSKAPLGKENVKSLLKTKLTSMSPRHATEKDLSHSLIELYTGQHISPPGPKNDTTPSELVVEKTKDVNLFGDDLTESEAQVLFSHVLLSNDVRDVTVPMDSSIKSSTTVDKVVEVSLSKDNSYKSNLDPPKASQEIKVPKKRGRKPKALLLAQQVLSVPPLKKQKLDVNIKEANLHLKHTLHNNIASNMKGSDVLQRPRKGRPPGSLNKNKTKKLPVNKIPKKPGRKALIKAVAQLSERNASSSLSVASLELPGTPLKNRSRSRTPVFGRPMDKDRGVASPSSSVLSTPILGKPYTPNAVLSRASTPLGHVRERRTPNPSPLPPNIKKLTCNNAIGETVLHKAVRHGYMDNILHYLEHGMEVNTKDNAGYTALHEACVKGRVGAARLLLEFGADVNINSEDGTRPIHDAVEYDHVEVTRLLLSCGADPMLSKFSGRAIRDMIHSSVMKTFLTSYLGELKPQDKEEMNEQSNWIVSASAVLDGNSESGCDVLANPPDEDSDCDEMEFELLDEEPFDTYLIQPTETICRSNFFILSELLRAENCSRGEFLLQHPADVKVGDAKRLTDEAERNWVQKKVNRLPETTNALIELISAESYRRNCRVFKVDNRGNVLSIPSTVNRSKNPAFYPHGAFCEQRTFAISEAPSIVAETPLEKADIPSCSRSPSESYGNLSMSSSDSEMAMSGVTSLTTTGEDAKEKAQENECLATKSHLFDNSTQNGIVEKTILYRPNGLSCQDIVKNPSPVLNPECKRQDNSDYQFQSLDIAPYSPTSDLRPPVVDDDDPTRTLTETENAVLNLAFGAGLPSIHVPVNCGLPQSDTALQFVHNITKSANPSKNQVKEFD